MITNQDLQRIRDVVKDEVSSGTSSLEIKMRQELRETEERIKNELETRIDSKILASEKRIIRDWGFC